MSNSTWLMDFLLILSLYGTILPKNSTALHMDYNANGVIDIYDLLDHLLNKPQLEATTSFQENIIK